ncbi:ATP-binding cassette subfamily C member 4-like isoform X4 [Neodiprion virginianus]|uniref:ATP-binding cassette subfamily C member 4-like isoform X4 n=2 Tax=Neodiprion virginianus TaxID=2961670 RepID=UPI001EE703BF|nr:ATP-binding cassette subfamily C member 4-like isoform X4 [Neodiprion virginianus]
MESTEERRDRKNLEERSNIFSRLIFGWTLPIFWKGARHNLTLQDLYDPLKSDESERLGNRLESEWKKELIKAERQFLLIKNGKKQPTPRPSLTWALIRVLWAPYAIQGLLIFVNVVVLRILQPIFQGWIINYFNDKEKQMTRNEALLYAGYLVVVTYGIIFTGRHNNLRTRQIGMCARVACCSLLYRKILRLDQTAMNNAIAGQVTNLMSNDVARLDDLLFYAQYIWLMPFQVLLIGYVMWQSVGVASLAGIGILLMHAIPFQWYLSNISAKLRSAIAPRTDKRVQFMSELISGIQVVKMYAWEKPFEFMVSKTRALEMKLIGNTTYLTGIRLSFTVLLEEITLFATLITFVLAGNTLTANSTFVIFTLFAALQLTSATFLPQAIVMARETAVSLERITDFLLLNEIKIPQKVKLESKHDRKCMERIKNEWLGKGIGIEMVNAATNWVYGYLPPTLSNVSIDVKSQSLSVLVGSVGSGKSSLLHLILGELKVGGGSFSFYTSVNGIKTNKDSGDIRISYASQDPWLFSASIRENILFGQPYDKIRYHEVTRVCALVKDFEQWPNGDSSFIGERGASVSGGQRARINLARAIYRDADVYLLDDPLSAVDTRVGRQLFEECIISFLKGKTRILVTHQLQYLRQADSVIVLDHGAVKYQGSYEELVHSSIHLLACQKSEKSDEDKEVEECDEVDTESNKATPVGMNGGDRMTKNCENIQDSRDVTEEKVERGVVSRQLIWKYFSAGGNLSSLIFITTIFIIGQLAISVTDYWVSYWTNQEAVRTKLQSYKSSANDTQYRNGTVGLQHEIDSSSQSQWFDEFGLLNVIPSIYIYAGFVISCIIFVTLRNMLFLRMCINASHNIHSEMFANLLQATMRFFNTNPSGRILNRFSKDIGTMDELLPKTMLESLQILFGTIGSFTMVALVNPWMTIPIVVICGIIYIIGLFYIRTAQDLKRFEGIAKSPVFSHVNSTLDGLPTIRSRGYLEQSLLRKEFDRLQDKHTGTWYLTVAGTAVLGLILDTCLGTFTACVCFSFILMDNETFLGGSVGLAISQSLVMTGTVQYGIRQIAEAISLMTSVERVLQYTKLPKEGPFTTGKPLPDNWPSDGRLIFKNVSMKYAENKPPALKDINIKINPGWKVGIVGRTGAGKSSLVSALFRLTEEGLDGVIELDGIDTKSVGLQELRPRISIIPQEPILFSATLRYNLDPFEQYSDTELWHSIRAVELGNVVSSLDIPVDRGGANFSVGQRQLICLARAILKNNQLLVLDEATANIDRSTDNLIQNAIRQRFATCTVLTIAHRLNTIMDSDRVLVMEEGRILEFDHPYLLLKDPNSHFSQMLQQTGKAMAHKLAKISEDSYQLSCDCRKTSDFILEVHQPLDTQ